MAWPRLIILPLAALLLAANGPLHFALDTQASSVSARVAYLFVGSKTVRFTAMDGDITIVPDDPYAASVDVEIDARNIEAPDRMTLRELQGRSFFWVERYPALHFSGSGLTMRDKTHGSITGELTARGVTRREELQVTFDKPPEEAFASGNITLTGEMTIDRRQYGMRAFPMVVGNQVNITMTARMVPSGN
jgi:polyisoprenoid-binding protein YceI